MRCNRFALVKAERLFTSVIADNPTALTSPVSDLTNLLMTQFTSEACQKQLVCRESAPIQTGLSDLLNYWLDL